MSELMKEPCQLVVARTMAHLVGSGEHGHVGLGISLPYRTPMEIERARRILACVNACARVPTESLEAQGLHRAAAPAEMTYTPTPRDITLILQAAILLGAEADDLHKCSTIDGDWPDDDAAAQDDYETMKTVQTRLADLAERMKA